MKNNNGVIAWQDDEGGVRVEALGSCREREGVLLPGKMMKEVRGRRPRAPAGREREYNNLARGCKRCEGGGLGLQ